VKYSKLDKRCLLAITGAFHSGGGIAAVNRLVIQALQEDGYQVSVYSLNEPLDIDMPSFPDQFNISYRTFSGIKSKYVLSIWKDLFRSEFSFVFSDHVNVAMALAPWAFLRHQRYLVWLHGVEVFPPRPDLEGRIGLHWAWKRLSSSDYTKRMVTERYPEYSIITCEPALDPARFEVDLPEKPIGRKKDLFLESIDGSLQLLGERVILHVSRMEVIERYKGHQELLMAFPQIQNSFPESQLVLVGDGNDYSYILSIAKSLPERFHSRVFMPGYVKSSLLNELYDQFYLFVMPSGGEGFGIVYIEAMSHAKPCLGGRVDATPCAIQEGVTGLLVDNPRSSTEISEKTCWILGRPEIARKMGMAGYERVRSNYLYPHFKARFLRELGG